jgi:hypothetical protein
MRRFQCPECGGKVEVAEDSRARRTECPSCKEVVLIPSGRVDAERAASETLEESGSDLLPWLGYGLTPTSLTCVPDGWADDEDCA